MTFDRPARRSIEDDFEGIRWKAGAVKDRRRSMRCVAGSTEALHSDGWPERIAKISKPKPAQMVQPEQVFPGTATKLASKDAGGFEGR